MCFEAAAVEYLNFGWFQSFTEVKNYSHQLANYWSMTLTAYNL